MPTTLIPRATLWLPQPLDKMATSTAKPASAELTTTAASLPPCPIFTNAYTAVGTVALVWGCTYNPYAPIEVSGTTSTTPLTTTKTTATTITRHNQTQASSTSAIRGVAPGPVASILAINAAYSLRPLLIFRALLAILHHGRAALASSSVSPALSGVSVAASTISSAAPPAPTTSPILLARYSVPPVVVPLTDSPLFAVVLPLQGAGPTQGYTTLMLSGSMLQSIPATGEPAWHSITVSNGDVGSWTTALHRIAGLLAIVEGAGTEHLPTVPVVATPKSTTSATPVGMSGAVSQATIGSTMKTAPVPETSDTITKGTRASDAGSQGGMSVLVVEQTRTVVPIPKTKAQASPESSATVSASSAADNAWENVAMGSVASGTLIWMSSLLWAWRGF